MFSVMNMWTDVFGSVGTRSTGRSGTLSSLGPTGKARAAGIKAGISFVDALCVDARADQANGRPTSPSCAIEDQYQLTPLSAGQAVHAPNDVAVDRTSS